MLHVSMEIITEIVNPTLVKRRFAISRNTCMNSLLSHLHSTITSESNSKFVISHLILYRLSPVPDEVKVYDVVSGQLSMILLTGAVAISFSTKLLRLFPVLQYIKQ